MAGQKSVDAAVERFAARSHNAWRRTFLKANPKEKTKPRMRMRAGVMVDINKPWTALDPKAQADNKRAGYAAFEALAKYPRDREAAAAHVHRAWIKRNRGDASLSKDLFKPYTQLPEIEKDKDRAHIDRMRAALAATRTPRKNGVKSGQKKSVGAKAAPLHINSATLRRLNAAAKRLSHIVGREVSAQEMIAVGAEAMLAMLDALGPQKKKR